MNDEELEGILRRYRTRNPGGDLRRRVLAASASDIPRQVPWFWGPVSAAAIFVLWLSVHASRIEREHDPIREAGIALIAETLGGGDEAVQYAELLVPEQVPEAPMSAEQEQAW
jgi:hypothetical protein